MPALVNNNVGSFPGTSELEGTTECPFFLKNSRKLARISELVIDFNLASRFIEVPREILRPYGRRGMATQVVANISRGFVCVPAFLACPMCPSIDKLYACPVLDLPLCGSCACGSRTSTPGGLRTWRARSTPS